MNLPNEVLLANDPFPLAASKRTEFVTLNTSQLNFSAWDSVTFHDLPIAASSPKIPGPLSSFRCPDSPGKANLKSLMAVSLFWNTLGSRSPVDGEVGNVPVFGRGPFRTADEVSSQFVAQKPRPGPIVKGNPLLQRNKPENCHPPTMASIQRLMPDAKVLPCPKGSSYTQLALI